MKIDIYDKKKNIKFEENNILQRYKSFCYICKLDNYGPTIKCKIEGCNIFCHPECARIDDYYFEIDYGEKHTSFRFYCHKHRPNRFIKYINRSTKNTNDEIFSFSNALNYVYQLYKNYRGFYFYPRKPSEKEINDDRDETEKIFKNIMDRRSKSRNRFNKKFIKKPKREPSYSVKNIVIDLKNNTNDNKINEQNINNTKEENNNLNNCVSNLKINCNENDKLNNMLNMNLINETNSIKSNNSHNYSNSSENNKLSTKYESLTPSPEDQKEEFALNLIKYLRNYFIKYRIFAIKNDNYYRKPEDNEEIEEFLSENLKNLEFEDLKNGKYNINKMELKKESDKKYKTIYKNEEEFEYYYKRKLYDKNKETGNIDVENIEIKKEEIKYEDNKNKSKIGKHIKKNNIMFNN